MRVMLAAGGTGGHVFPALALADELMRRDVELVWLGRKAGFESVLAAQRGIRFEPIPGAGFVGRPLAAKLAWPWVFLAGFVRSLRLVASYRPDAIVAAGGYAGAAPLLAAWLLRRPYYLLEQNRIPGRVTKLFLGWAEKAFFAFPPVGDGEDETLRHKEKKKEPGAERVVVTGNPLRPEIAGVRREDDGRTVLVLGGSGGARALNLVALDTAAALSNLNFIILTGRRDYALIRSRVYSHNVELVEFTERPEELYRRATLAVSRAGGMVLSELVACGIPAVLIPFPYAADRHQEANAEHLARVGAAIVLDQDRLSGLTSLVGILMKDEERRRRMEEACRRTALPEAARVIADRIVLGSRVKGVEGSSGAEPTQPGTLEPSSPAREEHGCSAD